MGARFHEHVGASSICHFAQQGLKAHGVGCGVRGLDDAIHNAVLYGAEHADFAVEQAVELVQQRHGRGLPVGARDRHHFHLARGVVVKRCRNVPERFGAGFHLNHSDVFRSAFRHLLADDACRS